MEQAVAGYVRGQLLLSAIIGTSAGIGIWLLGTLGWVPGIDQYAVLFGAWVASPSSFRTSARGSAGSFRSPTRSWSTRSRRSGSFLLFLGIHQIEGHIVVPKVMGSALRLHPLLVIFGLLAGGELYGLPGVLVALPLLAVMRAIYEFFSERVELEDWKGGVVPVEVDVEDTRPDQARAAGRATRG